jgi:CheY-like chemotaxis protein
MTDKVKILLIDDDLEFINNFGNFLERRGYEILKAGSGSHGIEVAENEKPHLILCDLIMIDMNGDEVIRHIKASNPDAIFIMMTAYVDESTKIKLKALGAHSFIEKVVKFIPTEAYIRQVLEENKIIHGRSDIGRNPVVGDTGK